MAVPLAIVIAAIDYATRAQAFPTWMHLLIALLPPSLGLIAMVILLLKFASWSAERAAGGTPERPAGLVWQALQIGSRGWSLAFVVVSLAGYSLSRMDGMPLVARGAFATAPLIPLVLYLRSISRAANPVDELAAHVRREAYGFAYWAMIGVFVCVYLLKQGGLLSAFEWNGKVIVALMVGLLITGAAISSRRYR